MSNVDYKKVYAIKAKNKARILSVCPDCPNTSGIYFLLRKEDGFKYAYIGQAKHILDRLVGHLSGYQHIDLSIKKHGLYSEENPTGYEIFFLRFSESELDEKEQYFIKKYANAGYQMRNKTSGSQGEGKHGIAQNRPAKGYFDGVEQGKKNSRKFIADLFNKHLVVSTKKDPPTKLQEKALQKFNDFINIEENI